MPDHMTPEQRSRAMQRVKLRNGSVEKIVQRELRVRGLKFQRHVRTLPGSPDIVFRKQRVAVFVDGDFWHGWRLPTWEHKLGPFWREKLRTNRKRDLRSFRKLRSLDWRVIRIWQHQLNRDREKCIQRVLEAVSRDVGELEVHANLSYPTGRAKVRLSRSTRQLSGISAHALALQG